MTEKKKSGGKFFLPPISPKITPLKGKENSGKSEEKERRRIKKAVPTPLVFMSNSLKMAFERESKHCLINQSKYIRHTVYK